jgi:hypothetical protein
MEKSKQQCSCGGGNPTCPTCNDLGGVQSGYHPIRPVILKKEENAIEPPKPSRVVNILEEINRDLDFAQNSNAVFHIQNLGFLITRISYWKKISSNINVPEKYREKVIGHLEFLSQLEPEFRRRHKNHFKNQSEAKQKRNELKKNRKSKNL